MGWWGKRKPEFSVSYFDWRAADGKVHHGFTLSHEGSVQEVSSIGGFPTKEDAEKAVEALSKGFRIAK